MERIGASSLNLILELIADRDTKLRFEAYEFESRFYVNPGSATGAFVASTAFSSEPTTDSKADDTDASSSAANPPSPTPSFVLLDIQGNVVVTYVYQLVAGEVKVEKLEARVGHAQAVPQQ